ncbi:4-hydroxyphenylacetate decarboxylase small subunit [Candidatus Binatia bacterium]|nr:4-hydroxyphenylacetate decarboxylase small subunit [Candidatus Binatia bacterium]
MDLTCNDCRFYLPVDVFKGLCKKSRERVDPETAECKTFEKRHKCKFCSRYTSSEAFVGTCSVGGVPTYPDLNGTYCGDFQGA